jgi:hypothetical protein
VRNSLSRSIQIGLEVCGRLAPPAASQCDILLGSNLPVVRSVRDRKLRHIATLQEAVIWAPKHSPPRGHPLGSAAGNLAVAHAVTEERVPEQTRWVPLDKIDPLVQKNSGIPMEIRHKLA